MNKILVTALIGALTVAAFPAVAGRDSVQLLLQEKANREAVARRQCGAQPKLPLDHGPRAQVPQRVGPSDRLTAARRSPEEIAACVGMKSTKGV